MFGCEIPIVGLFSKPHYHTPYVLPHPPCCKIPACRKCTEDNFGCVALGKCGIRSLEKHRGLVMLFAAFLSFTGIILQTIPVVAISEDREPRKSAAWITADATANGTEGKLWLALSGIELDQFAEIRSVDWDSNTCSVTIDQDACEKCRDASESSYSTALLSLITAVPQFLTDIQRSTPEGDLNCQKFFGIATGIIGFFGTITAITSYIQDCRDNLPDRFAGTDEEIDYDLGPALVCLTIATFLKVIDVIVHAMMPVPVRDHVSQGSEVSENVQCNC